MLRALSSPSLGSLRARPRAHRGLCAQPAPPHPAAAEASPFSNISPQMWRRVGTDLHLQQDHPLGIIKRRIERFCRDWAEQRQQPRFEVFDRLDPVVSTKACFDDLLVPAAHPSRSRSDTYYVDEQRVLRTHTSAHQTALIGSGLRAFLCSGDVYRRDEIDATHFPVFHQMEGVRVYGEGDFAAGTSVAEAKRRVEQDLKELLTGLAKNLFGDVECRWREDFFPFTEPSFELEVRFGADWLEVLGCGVIHDQVLRNASQTNNEGLRVGWAFGLGLERLAMILFDIPDIRLFWSTDERFLSQFRGCGDEIRRFVPYSKYPLCYKDVSFWLPDPAEGFHRNNVFEVIRSVAGDLVERVQLFDEFTNKQGRVSQAYRIDYRHFDRSLTNEEVDLVQSKVRAALVETLGVQLR